MCCQKWLACLSQLGYGGKSFIVLVSPQAGVIYEKYFSTLRSITTTTLDILNDRIFSHHAKNYLDWNIFPNLRSPLFLQQTAPASAGFTAVILTYDRLDSLFAVINRVAAVPSLAQILVVWNNQVTSCGSIAPLNLFHKVYHKF